jgi:hypothetical protein
MPYKKFLLENPLKAPPISENPSAKIEIKRISAQANKA